MMKQGFNRCSYDPCLYFKGTEVINCVFLLLYVDDMLLIRKSMSKVIALKQQLSTEFDMKDLVEAKKILGISILINRKKDSLVMSQQGYLEKLIDRFSMRDSKPVRLPLGSHFQLSSEQNPSTQSDKEYMGSVPYSSVGITYALYDLHTT